jgi:hypothetical protein
VLIATTHSEGGKERSALDVAVAEVAEAVSAGGGGHVAFNPITTATMKKLLRQVRAESKKSAPPPHTVQEEVLQHTVY